MAEEAASIKELNADERAVNEARMRLARTAAELERRGREMFDWRAHLRKHRVALGMSVLVLAVLVGTPIIVATWSRSNR